MHDTTTDDAAFSDPNPVRDVLVVAAPIVGFGTLGTALGLETLLGGALVNVGYVLAVALGGVVLRRQGTGWRELGLRRPRSWPRTALSGVGAFLGAVVVFVALQAVSVGVLLGLGFGGAELDQSRFNPVEGNLPLYLLLVAVAWTTIAFGEELFYRAFVLTRLIDHTRVGRWSALLLAGALFGVVHVAEGPVGVVSNGGFGVLFGWIYLCSDRNLWITVVGHGLLNTLRFTLLYVGIA